MLDIRFHSISEPDCYGVRLSRIQGDLYRTISVAVDKDGQVIASSGFEDVDDLSLLTTYRLDDVSTTQRWVWSLLAGQIDSSVLAALGVIEHVKFETSAFEDTALAQLTEHVDQDAVALLRSSAEPKLSHLSFYSGSDERALNRKRHGQIYPALSDVMAAKLQTKRVIDTKTGSLPDAVCKAISTSEFEVTPAYLKRFAKITSFPKGCDRAAMVAFSADLPPDWLPSSAEEWEAYAQIATAVMGQLSPSPEQVKILMKSAGGKWTQLRSKILQAAFPVADASEAAPLLLPAPAGEVVDVEVLVSPEIDVLDRLQLAMQNIKDMTAAFCGNVVLPMIAYKHTAQNVFLNSEVRAAAEAVAFKMLLENRGIVDATDMGRRYHQERHTLLEGDLLLQAERRRFLAYQVDGEWPGLTARRQAPNGLWLVPLTSRKHLREESRQLDHCVGEGGYDAPAERCDSHIISVQEDYGVHGLGSISTVEIKGIRSPTGPFTVVQHRSHNNSNPSTNAQEAFAWYLDSLKAGNIEVNWEMIKAFKTVENRNIDAVERMCRYDWRDPQFIFSATVPWQPFLVKAYRNMNFEDLFDVPELVKVTDLIAPEVLRMASGY